MSAPQSPDRSASHEKAWAAAARTPDPEIPALTIADLGILHDVSIAADGRVNVVILPTYSGCPAMGMISMGIETELAKDGFENVRVELSQNPAWTTDRMSAQGREKLRACGIAPPAAGAGKRALFSDPDLACPRCGAARVERISEFGSTACKSLWRCQTCREPFEHFKCI